MFSLIALICFVLALFGVSVGIDLVVLGFVFITLHLLFGLWPLAGAVPWRRVP